jgi:hypothetical protein
MQPRVKLDTTAAKKSLETLENAYVAALAEGLGQAGGMLLNDAVMELNTVPLDTGFLRGSGSFFVNGKMVHANTGGSPATNLENTGDERLGRMVLVVGFNTVYAAVMHEGGWQTGPLAGHVITHYRESGSGKFFLLSKLVAHHRLYVEVAANYAKSKVGM